MRSFLAWVLGIIVCIAVGVGLTFVGEKLGVPSSIDLDEPTTITHGSGRYSYDEEVTSLQTSYGYVSGAFAIVIGLWAGQAAFHQKLGAGFTREGWFSFLAWLIALGALMVISVLIHLAFAKFHGALAYYMRMFLELSAIGGIGWSAHQWYKNRIASLRTESEASYLPPASSTTRKHADAEQAGRDETGEA